VVPANTPILLQFLNKILILFPIYPTQETTRIF
jgi:hypothetical protein